MACEPFIPLSDRALLQEYLHGPQIFLLDLLTRHFGIPLGRGDLTMPQEVANYDALSPLFEHVRGWIPAHCESRTAVTPCRDCRLALDVDSCFPPGAESIRPNPVQFWPLVAPYLLVHARSTLFRMSRCNGGSGTGFSRSHIQLCAEGFSPGLGVTSFCSMLSPQEMPCPDVWSML